VPGIVAPFTGAWIETANCATWATSSMRVAPFTGAWIETMRSLSCAAVSAGRALHGRVD